MLQQVNDDETDAVKLLWQIEKEDNWLTSDNWKIGYIMEHWPEKKNRKKKNKNFKV